MDVLSRRVGVEGVQPLDRRQPFLDGVRVVLRKVANRYLMAPTQHAGIPVRCGDRRLRQLRRISEERLEECRLARSVLADEHDLVAAMDDGAEAGEDRPIAKRLRE